MSPTHSRNSLMADNNIDLPGIQASKSPNHALENVTEVAGWVFQEDLGSGAFGRVRKAVHKATGAQAAIKIIRLARVLSLYKQPDIAKKKLEREIRILKLLDHPNIVRLYDAIE